MGSTTISDLGLFAGLIKQSPPQKTTNSSRFGLKRRNKYAIIHYSRPTRDLYHRVSTPFQSTRKQARRTSTARVIQRFVVVGVKRFVCSQVREKTLLHRKTHYKTTEKIKATYSLPWSSLCYIHADCIASQPTYLLTVFQENCLLGSNRSRDAICDEFKIDPDPTVLLLGKTFSTRADPTDNHLAKKLIGWVISRSEEEGGHCNL
jgi:hypothetical protein